MILFSNTQLKNYFVSALFLNHAKIILDFIHFNSLLLSYWVRMSHNMYHKEPKLEAPNSDYPTQQHQRGMHQRRTHLPQSSLMEQVTC